MTALVIAYVIVGIINTVAFHLLFDRNLHRDLTPSIISCYMICSWVPIINMLMLIFMLLIVFFAFVDHIRDNT